MEMRSFIEGFVVRVRADSSEDVAEEGGWIVWSSQNRCSTKQEACLRGVAVAMEATGLILVVVLRTSGMLQGV